MKNCLLKSFFVVILFMSALAAKAWKFEGMDYETVKGTTTCKLVAGAGADYSVDVVIPAEVEYSGKTYTVVEIADEAFMEYSLMKSITIPSTVTKIGNNAFMNCNQLKNVYVDDIASWLKIEFKSTSANPVYYANTLYVNGEKLTELVIPAGTTKINDYAFFACQSLTKVTFADEIESIGASAFSECKNIAEFVMPASLKTISESAFNGCTSLTTVTVSPKLTKISGSAFATCTKLNIVNISDLKAWFAIEFGSENANPVAYARNIYLNGELLENLEVPAGVTTIKEYAFANASIASVKFHESFKSVAKSAFKGCTKLEKVDVASIASWLNIDFSDASANPLSLAGKLYINGTECKNLEIPEGTSAIKKYAFSNAVFETVVIPSTLKTVASSAFSNVELNGVYINDLANWCTIAFANKDASPLYQAHSLYLNGEHLTTVEIPVESVAKFAFMNSDIETLVVPNTVKTIGDNAFAGCDSIKTLTIDMATVPASFAGCPNLNKVVFGESVTAISKNAFKGCGALSHIEFAENIATIESAAFADCSSLKYVNVPSFDKWFNVNFIDEKANPVYYAQELYVNGVKMEEIRIPEGTTSIKPYMFSGGTLYKKVTIPASVDTIGKSAFSSCINLEAVYVESIDEWLEIEFGDKYANPLTLAKKLYIADKELKEEVVIPEGVTKVNKFAFQNCAAITSVTFPASIDSVGSDAFAGCENISSVNVEDLNKWCTIVFENENSNPLYLGKALLHGSDTLKHLVIDNATTIKNNAFRNCYTIESITFGEGVETIGENAFTNCSNLAKIELPSTLKTLYSNTFTTCPNLSYLSIDCDSVGDWFTRNKAVKKVVLGDNVKKLAKNAFNGCANLDSISLGANIDSIGQDAFTDCAMLAYVNISDVEKWCSIALVNEKSNPLYFGKKMQVNGKLTTDIEIPETVTEIKNYVFNGAPIESLYIPESVTTIGANSFKGCKNLANIDLNVGCEEVADWFKDMRSIKSIVFGKNIKTIANSAFENCLGLTSVTLGENITNIGARTFRGCAALQEITFNNDSIGLWFKDLSTLREVTFNSNVKTIAADAFVGCANLNKVNISDLAAWCKIDFENYASTPLCNSAQLYLNGSLLKNLEIPADVDTIAKNVFRGCTSIETVKIPEGVVAVDDYAFCGASSIESIEFPSSLSYIGTYSFYENKGLQEITIPDGVTELADYTFAACESLKNIEFGANMTSLGYGVFSDCYSLPAVTIPNTVTSLGGSAFENCFELQQVALGEGISEIQNATFASCVSLNDITFATPVTKIDGAAFAACQSLESFELPNTLESLGEAAFYACSSLTEIEIPASLTAISEETFADCASLTKVTIPSTIASIGAWAFDNCTALEGVYINDLSAWCETEFGYKANPLTYAGNLYVNNELVTELNISSDVTAINDYAFSGCTSLANVLIGEGVTKIGNEAFYGCSNVTEVSIPASVKTIGNAAFYDCAAITKVAALAETPAAMGTYVFNSNVYDTANLVVPAGTEAAYKAAAGWRNFKSLPTSIDSVLDGNYENGVYYNLQGVAVENPTKGVYIYNGSKVVIE